MFMRAFKPPLLLEFRFILRASEREFSPLKEFMPVCSSAL